MGGFSYQREAAKRGAHVGRGALALIAVFVIVLVVPLMLTSLRTYATSATSAPQNRRRATWVKGAGCRVMRAAVGDDIVVGVVGSGAPPPLQELRTAARRTVRRTVPRTVPVQVVEGSGRTIEL